MKFYLYKKREGGAEKNSHAEGVVLTQEIEDVDILKGEHKMFPYFKSEGREKF